MINAGLPACTIKGTVLDGTAPLIVNYQVVSVSLITKQHVLVRLQGEA